MLYAARALALGLSLALFGCPSRPVASSAIAPGDDRALPSPDALAPDAVAPETQPARRCPTRAHPPEEVSVGEAHEGPVALAFNGRQWGVAWTEQLDGAPAVFFVRLGRDGRRVGNSSRVSETGYRGHHPSIAWNGEAWSVAFAGGPTPRDQLWLAQVDPRGVTIGHARAVTSRDRDDEAPALLFDGRGLLLAWTARNQEGRSAVFTLRMSLWGAQLAPPTVLVQRSERLSRVQMVSAPPGVLLAWLVSRRGEAVAVESVRVDANGNPRGAVRRAGPVPLGGADSVRRFSLAFGGDGTGAALAWDEVRDGLSHALFRVPTARLEGPGVETVASDEGEPARAPAVVTLGAGYFALAYESERTGAPHVRVRTLDARGNAEGEAVELQGHDRRAQDPVMVLGDGAVGVATLSARAVSFHRVELGPCVRPPPPPPPEAVPSVAPE